MDNSKQKHDFLERNQAIFWHFDKSKLDKLPDDIIVEYILNYGNLNDVKELFSILGIKEVANIFFKNTLNRKRTNYLPEVSNFFTLYFKRNAH